MSNNDEPLMFDDNHALLAEIRASDRFNEVTIEYWLGWLLNQNLVIEDANDVLNWIGKMENMLGKNVAFEMPNHWIDESRL
jgi:hypothetical protein